MRKDIVDRKQEILNWIDENQSKSFMCRELKCKPETLESYLKKFGITYNGNKGLKGKKINTKYVQALDYIKGSFVSAHKLKLKMIRDGIKEHKCECVDKTFVNTVYYYGWGRLIIGLFGAISIILLSLFFKKKI